MRLAEEFPDIELISMDSALVYRGMDIGTAKPTLKERRQVKHHLIDLIDPTESYSAAQFIRDASQAAESIRKRGKLPLLVGGTMLYFKAYQEGLDDLPSVPLEIRQQIAQEAEAKGWPFLHAQLSNFDPQTAARLNANDAQRISRALELYRFTGKTMTALITESTQRRADLPHQLRGEPLNTVALLPQDRAQLHARIAERFHAMLKAGFLDEVEALKARGDLHLQQPSMRCVGYRQAWEYLEGKTSRQEFIDAGIAATRQLAKRQITWLRSFTGIRCVDPFEMGFKELSSVLGQAFAAELHPSDRPVRPAQ